MGALAVVSLVVTVLLAQRALTDASDIVVRGEGDALVSAVVQELAALGAPPTRELLEKELELHQAQGLRYVRVPDGTAEGGGLSAGTPTMDDSGLRPGESKTLGNRVRTGRILPPSLRRHGPFSGRPHPPFGGPPGPPELPPLLVIELEPPVLEKLRSDLTRISVVAAIAGAVLLAFAIAWARSTKRLAAVEERAAREQRLVALGSMSSVMAHELRNPLASLKGHAQLLVEDITDEKQRQKAQRVVSEAERLEVLTTNLLDFVRDGPMELTPMTPSELVEQSLEHLPSKRVKVVMTSPAASLRIDGIRMARALHNLVENALQATPDEQDVELEVAHSGDTTLISVRDHGPGIAAGSESQIFEPFITTRVRGTGLGLAVARRIAEQHGGSLTGENHPSGGAIFRLRFPDVTSPV